MEVHREWQPVVDAAREAGWVVEEPASKRKTGAALVLKAPDGRTILRVPNKSSGVDHAQIRGFLRKIAASIPSKDTELLEAEREVVQAEQQVRNMRRNVGRVHRGRGNGWQDGDEPPAPIITPSAMPQHRVRMGATPAAPTSADTEDPAMPAVPEPSGERYVLTEKPAMAHFAASRAGGKTYESTAALERVWSDGTVDYICPECRAFTGSTHRSVASHYAGAHRRGKGETRPAQFVLDPSYTEPVSPARPNAQGRRDYHPQARVVDALRAYLVGTLSDDGWADPEQVAIVALSWAHERPDLPDNEAEHKPLDDAAILDRIRTLVMGPVLVQTRAQLDELAAEVDRLTKELEETVAERDRAWDDLDGFAAIAAEAAARRAREEQG